MSSYDPASDDLTALSALELGPLVARREVSPVELVRQTLARMDATDPVLNCFVARRDEAALAEARAAEAEILGGRYRGPLHGIPLAVKDNLAVAGTVTAAGAKFLAHNATSEDAECIRRLRAAGAIVVGKTNLHELAAGSTTINPHYGTTHNPWRLDHVAGGSSGGSAAALAARQVALALGTDHAGSIRMPASLCNVVGLKPTHGRVSARGLVATRNVTADHVGPMTRTVGDAALMLQAMAGYDPLDPTSQDRPMPEYSAAWREDLRGLRVGVPSSYYFDLMNAETGRVVHEALGALEQLGATLVEVEIPDLEALMAARVALGAEGLALAHEHLKAHPDQISEDLRRQLYALYFVSARDMARASRARRLLCERFAAVLEEVDLIASAATCIPAFPIEARTIRLRDNRTGQETEYPPAPLLVRLTSPSNLTGLPAISVPAGFTADGLPVGLQLQARPFEEATLLGAARTYEQQARWFERRPDRFQPVSSAPSHVG